MRIQAITLNHFKNFLRLNQKPQKNVILDSSFDTFTFSGKRKTKSEIKTENEKLKALLRQALDNKQTVSLEQLAKEIGDITPNAIHFRITRNEELNSLWQLVKTRDYAIFSKEENQEFEDAVKNILLASYRKQEKIFIKTIADKVGITSKKVAQIINSDEECLKMYEKIKIIPKKIPFNSYFCSEWQSTPAYYWRTRWKRSHGYPASARKRRCGWRCTCSMRMPWRPNSWLMLCSR